MNVRDIVRKAWQVTQVHLKKLIWLGAVPAFFHTIVSSVYLAYQYNALRHSSLFEPQPTFSLVDDLKMIWGLVTSHPEVTIVVITLGILVVGGNFLIPPIFRGALIHALMQIKNYKPMTGSMEMGVRKFFPMLEFAIVTGSFSILTIFTESSFILRWWGQGVLMIALPILLFIATVGLIASFLFTYSEYFIVLQDKKLIESISESAILVLANFRKTLLILILMILIGARAILNVILVLLIPMGMVFMGGYLATQVFNALGFIIVGLIVLTVLALASYLMGLFNVFATAVWVFTYAELTEKNEE